jgi:type II secretory pathway component PulK
MTKRSAHTLSVRVDNARGVALLMVLAMLALLGTLVADFQYTARVDIEMAYSARDTLQAEYNALSALRMRALLLKQSRKVGDVAKLLGGMGGAPGAPGAAAGGGGMQMPLGQILEMIPVECGLMNAITRRVDRRMAHDKSAEHEDFFVGECMATSESEHSKIPVNLLRNNIQDRATTVAQMLLGLLSDARLRHFFDSDDHLGSHIESPLLLVQAITDWTDADHTEALNLGDEDRHYQSLKDPYRAKNAPFDSISELQLVHGMSDGLYQILRDNVTIYNDNPSIELSTAPLERIVYWGLPAALKDGLAPEALLPGLPALAKRIATVRALGSMMPMTISVLQQLITQSGMNQIIDSQKLAKVFSDASSITWYTLVAEGRMNRATRRIRAVFQASEGQFYYVRID